MSPTSPGARKPFPTPLVIGALLVMLLLAILFASGCRPKPAPVVERPDTVQVDSTAPVAEPTDSAVSDSASDDSTAADTTCMGGCGPEVTAKDTLSQVPAGRRRAITPANLPVGLSHWPLDKFCNGPLTGTVVTVTPDAAPGVLHRAADCGVRVMLAPPRRYMTTNGENNGHFSLSRAKEQVDRLARRLPPSESDRYPKAFGGWWMIDEPKCANCWGGRSITPSDLSNYLAYARQKLGHPIIARENPQNLRGTYPGAVKSIDAGWVVWTMRRSLGQRAYYDLHASIARDLGIKVALVFNAADCSGNLTSPCSASQIAQYSQVAATHAANCFDVSWQWESGTWGQSAIRTAWGNAVNLGRAQSARSCRK